MSEDFLTKFGTCKSCDKLRTPLTDRGVCPSCAFPIAGVTYDEAIAQGLFSKLERDKYAPVSGVILNAGKKVVMLYGWVHPTRSREGWAYLLEQSAKDGATNLRMGNTLEYLFESETGLEERRRQWNVQPAQEEPQWEVSDE